MTPAELLAFLRSEKLMVEATVNAEGSAQAAVVGYAVSAEFELVFDTLQSTRKYQNLRRDPRVAVVIGWDQVTVQLEGVADFPEGPELERLKECYFGTYPDGRERMAWPGITHVRVRPRWARYSDFRADPPRIEELAFD